MTGPDLSFDEAAHTYRVRGTPCPSVTGILRAAGFIDSRRYSEEHRELGTMVHLATALHDRGELDEDDLDPAIAPYLSAWKKYRRLVGYDGFEAIERPFYCLDYGCYAGTIDRVAAANGVRMIIDIKTGSPELWHRLQTAAYALAFEEHRPLHVGRCCVYLSADGEAYVRGHRDESDVDAWIGLCAAHHWLTNHRVKERTHAACD